MSMQSHIKPEVTNHHETLQLFFQISKCLSNS